MADIFVSDYDKQFKEILTGFDTDGFCETWVENQQWQLDFEIEKTEANPFEFDLLDYESSVFFLGQEFIVKQLSHEAQGNRIFKKVTAPHISYTMQDGYQYNTRTGTLSAVDCLKHIFSGQLGAMGFTYEFIDKNKVVEKVEQENFGNGNYLQLVQEVLEDYKLVMLADNKHLTFMPREDYGQVTENEIRYQYNTDQVSFDIDTLSMKTQIKGFGKKKEDDTYYFPPVTYTSPEAEKWGIRIQPPVEDERYTVAGNMDRRLRLDLQDYPATTGNITLKLPYECDKGDYVRFIYEPMGLNYDIQIVGYKQYPFSAGKAPEITLSNNKKTIVNIMAQLAKAIKKKGAA
ncbi:phage tail protein [Listeria aquatica]|uniref:phage tail protein n=1 Tax=Listeria aquatica TaxID=1494960 RepID=UPI0031F4FF38